MASVAMPLAGYQKEYPNGYPGISGLVVKTRLIITARTQELPLFKRRVVLAAGLPRSILFEIPQQPPLATP